MGGGNKTVAVIDGGGRGAALVEKYVYTKGVGQVLAIPGNDLMKRNHADGHVETFPGLKTTSVPEIVKICRDRGVDLVDVAQDNAVAAGLVNALRDGGLLVLGPTKEAGKIEWSKSFGRMVGEMVGLRQPKYTVCTSVKAGLAFLATQPEGRWYIKADGLHEGKGALAATGKEEAARKIREVHEFTDGSGKTFLIEDWLSNGDGTPGEEFSAFGLSDGKRVKMLGYAQDHKRVGNFDEGPNTGGMGCSTPPLVLTDAIKTEVQEMFDKIISGLSSQGAPYQGVLYLGGMLLEVGTQLRPFVVEWNARWGDPEAQCIVPGIKNNFLEMGIAAASGDISGVDIVTDGKSRVVVAGASKGYPGDYSGVKGRRIFGLDEVWREDGASVYGAGVTIDENGIPRASGGRLFYVVGEGDNVEVARWSAYGGMTLMSVEGNNLHYRTDIGWRDMERLNMLQAVQRPSP